jgi:hypothetical protein
MDDTTASSILQNLDGFSEIVSFLVGLVSNPIDSYRYIVALLREWDPAILRVAVSIAAAEWDAESKRSLREYVVTRSDNVSAAMTLLFALKNPSKLSLTQTQRVCEASARFKDPSEIRSGAPLNSLQGLGNGNCIPLASAVWLFLSGVVETMDDLHRMYAGLSTEGYTGQQCPATTAVLAQFKECKNVFEFMNVLFDKAPHKDLDFGAFAYALYNACGAEVMVADMIGENPTMPESGWYAIHAYPNPTFTIYVLNLGGHFDALMPSLANGESALDVIFEKLPHEFVIQQVERLGLDVCEVAKPTLAVLYNMIRLNGGVVGGVVAIPPPIQQPIPPPTKSAVENALETLLELGEDIPDEILAEILSNVAEYNIDVGGNKTGETKVSGVIRQLVELT